MKPTQLSLCALVILFFFSVSPAWAGGAQYFLKIDGIDGHTATRDHEKDISISGYDLSADEAGVTSFSIQKGLDIASAPLLTAFGGQTSYSATFVGVKSAGSRALIIKMVFHKLAVTSFQSVDAGAQVAQPVEKLTFSFDSVDITYYDPSPLSGVPVEHTVTIYSAGHSNC